MLYRSFQVFIIIFFCTTITSKITAANLRNEFIEALFRHHPATVEEYRLQQRQYMLQPIFSSSTSSSNVPDFLVSAGTMLGFYCISYVYEKITRLTLYLSRAKKNQPATTTNEQKSPSTPADPLFSPLTEQLDLVAPKEEPTDPLNPPVSKQLNLLAPEKTPKK